MTDPNVHGSSDLLGRFARGELEGALRDAVVNELAQCAECRAIVGALARRDAPPTRPAPPTSSRGPEEREAPGTRIAGHYVVEGVLGAGGMGVVYRVRHELLGRAFALKTLRPDRATHEPSVRRFLQEARALAAVGHPGIVDVVDVGRDERERPYLVMPLLEGQTLEARLSMRGRLPVLEAMEIAAGVLEALAAAHAAGVVHRDVKPANVFLLGGADATRVSLLDFGLAKLQRDIADASETSLTHTGALLGTPRYMAPEQWAGVRTIDARADLFAWAVTTYRALTATYPYELAPGALAPRPDLRAARPDVPIEVAQEVERALAPSPAERPSDAGAVAAVFRQAIARVAPARLPATTRASRPPRAELAGPTVGRRALVLQLADRLVAGAHAVLAVVGPEGVGKTMVLHAVQAELRARGLTPLVAREAEGSGALEALASLQAAPEPRATELSLRALLSHPDHVLFVERPASLDPASRRLLLGLAREGALRMMVESRDDATLGETGSELDALLTLATRVHVGGLDPHAVAELVRARGVTLESDELTRLVERTGGHPLFVLTCLALRGERRAPTDDVPADLEAAVLARVAALPAEEARTWQVAAVLGDAFGVDDLRALGAVDAERAVPVLVARDVLRESPKSPGRFGFTAGLLASVVERAMPASEVALLHHRAALLRTRELDRTPGPESWARLAAHHERAGALIEAADAYALAALGRRASLRKLTPPPDDSTWLDAGFDRRARWAERALALAEQAQSARDDQAELALARVEGLAGDGRFTEASAAIDAIDPSSLAPETRARALVEKGTYLQRAGRHDEALGVLGAAADTARAAGESAVGTLALAVGRHAVSLAFAGRVDEARDRLWEAEEIVLARVPARRADLAGWKAQVAGLSGDLAERRDAYWAAVELFRAEGNARFAAFSLLNLGDTYARLGAHDEAERALARAARECQALGAVTMAGYAALNLGHVLLRVGRRDEAAREIARAEAIAARTDDARLSRYAVLYAAELGVASAVDALRASSDGGRDATWSALRAAVLAASELDAGRVAEALVLARAARDVVDAAGALEEGEADVDLVLVRALEASRLDDEARAVARRAAMRIREVARRIAGAHWRTFFLEDVAAHRELLMRAAR